MVSPPRQGLVPELLPQEHPGPQQAPLLGGDAPGDPPAPQLGGPPVRAVPPHPGPGHPAEGAGAHGGLPGNTRVNSLKHVKTMHKYVNSIKKHCTLKHIKTIISPSYDNSRCVYLYMFIFFLSPVLWIPL